MILMKVLWAFLSVGLLGALFGIGLFIASRFLAVKKDERVEQLAEALPGLNCGACGYAGCDSYAEAIVTSEEELPLDLCKPGGASAASELGRIMGREVEVSDEKLVAQVHCRGGRETSQYNFDYEGMEDCNAAAQLYGGPKTCSYGCMGLGSCIKVCPVDAIDYDESGLVWVDKEICISCGKCIDICPTGVMKWVPYEADVFVACNSKDKGNVVRKYCKVGCIACGRCSRSSPDGGFVVEDFLAHVDYSKTGERISALNDCPTKCIIRTVKAESEEPEQPREAVAVQESSEKD